MGNNDKATPPKATTTELTKTTTDQVGTLAKSAESAKAIEPAKTTVEPVKPEETGKANADVIKAASNAFESASTTVKPSVESITKAETPGADKKAESLAADARTKMDIATEIYKRMKKTKGVTRKEIVEQFVAEAKLSKAGASTYYQLIKAKVR